MKQLLGVVLTALLLLGMLGPAQSAAAGAAAGPSQPNVVFILTDDMRADDLQYMPFTRDLLRRTGTDFTGAISPHPICCPARASLITGQYAQNNGVHHNKGEWGGYGALASRDDLIFDWFDRAGYRTSYTGKLMNGYHGGPISGLDYNDAAVKRVYRARGVITWNNGRPTRRKGHQTFYTTASAVQSIKAARGRPFFSWVGYVAPHRMTKKKRSMATVPPPGYHRFRERSHRRPPSMGTPAFNAPLPYTTGREQSPDLVRVSHRSRVLALYAVDDGVRQIVRALRRSGEYRDTILVFSSDNGMGMGAHRQMGKNNPYVDTLRVPLLMAGPGVPSGHEVDEVTTLVDLPRTLAELAGVTPTRDLDGVNMLTPPQDRTVLIQAGASGSQWLWRGVFTRQQTYVLWPNGNVEFYDRTTDPYEVDNRPHDTRVPEFRRRLEALKDCSSTACHSGTDVGLGVG